MQQNHEELSELTNQKLIEEVKKNKSTPIADAFFVGILIGIIIYSIVVNSWGFLTLIPLLLIYGLVKKSKRIKALKKEMNDRGLE